MDALTSESGLPAVIDALRWRWKLILLVAVFATAGAMLYVWQLPSQYDATAIVAYSPRPEAPNAGGDTLRVVVPKYVAYVEAPRTIDEVAETAGVDRDALADAVDANVATDTGNVSITVRLRSPERAAEAANAFAESAVDFSRADELLSGQVVALAIPPDEAAAPPRALLGAAAVLVGLLLGIGVSVLLERGRPRVRSWRDIATLTGYPVVGRIPATTLVRRRPNSAFADPATGSAFRALRANLEPQLGENGVDVILVTSPSKGDGKTTVAALFAESLSRLGKRVLLMDADLHHPRVAQFARVNSNRGLADVLREETSFERGVMAGWSEDLAVLPTAADPEAGDLLARRFSEVAREARDRYDLVVVDTPPILGTDDALTLARMVDGVLIVVSAGTAASSVNEAILALEALHAPILGVVGNRMREAKGYYYA